MRLALAALRLEGSCFFSSLCPISASLVRFWIVDWSIAGPELHKALATYVMDNTEPDDTVLVWGVDTAINFQSGRDSPTPYNHGYPLIVPNEESGENVRQMVKDLERNKPVMIVDTTLRDGDRIPPLHPLLRRLWWFEGGRRDIEQLGPIYRFVESYCHVATEYDGAIIYRCRYPIRTGLPGGVLIDPPVQAAADIWNIWSINTKSRCSASSRARCRPIPPNHSASLDQAGRCNITKQTNGVEANLHAVFVFTINIFNTIHQENSHNTLTLFTFEGIS